MKLGNNKRLKIIRAATVPQSLDTFCRGILNELSEKYEVIALSSPGEALDRVANREGVRTISVNMARHISLIQDVMSLFQLFIVFCKERPAMVHSMTPKAGLLCMVAGKLAGVPLRIHTFTGLVFPTSSGLKRKILVLTDKMTCAFATHVIPEGEGVKKDLIDYHITSKPMRVLGYGNVRGVDMAYYSRRKEVLEAANTVKIQGIFTFLFVGRIVGDKGINELMKAFIRLRKTKDNIRLILVGKFEEKLDPINESSAEIIKNTKEIQYVGAKYGDELLAYYAASDCFVFPSYREGFPNTVLEAGAMGLPSIVTDINGSREIIVEGENGMIIPSKDDNALYLAMKNMIDDGESYIRMSKKTRTMIESRFEQSFVRKCLFDFYDEVM